MKNLLLPIFSAIAFAKLRIMSPESLSSQFKSKKLCLKDLF